MKSGHLYSPLLGNCDSNSQPEVNINESKQLGGRKVKASQSSRFTEQ